MTNVAIYIIVVLLLSVAAIAVLVVRCFRLSNRVTELSGQLAAAQSNLEMQRQLEAMHKAEREREDAKREEDFDRRAEAMRVEFQNMANAVLKARSDELTASSDERLRLLLEPFATHLSMFKNQMEKAFDDEKRDKNSLREQIIQLTQLNNRMSADANNLTRALKGDVKQQGCWGEVILERVLESSGLRQGYEYEREVVVKDDEGTTYRPDVIVKLPDDKHIIIDSKVSLTAYTRYIEAADDADRAKAQRELVQSVLDHVKTLGQKHYQKASGLNTPDFVLLFMPIEGAFALAVQTQTDLYATAWEKKIVIVSPSTLLATLRTVSSIWQQENQTKNALEIARIAGTLYDKLAAMQQDFNDINTHLIRAQKAYEAAMNKIVDGRDSIARKAERLKELGAKTTRQLKTD